MSSFKEYLGDSVYADFDGFAIVLTTENGDGASNTIVLEPQVLNALNKKESNNQPRKMTTKEKFKQQLEAEIKVRQDMIAALDGLGLENTTEPATMYGAQIDFDNLSHEKVIEVIRAIGGKWEKTPSVSATDRIDYKTTKNGITIRCYQGEPPPNCHIEEVLETIPAQPERVVTRKKLVCK